MEYTELFCDSAVAFNSSLGGSSSKNTPDFYVGNGFTDVLGIKVIEVIVPTSWYNVRDNIILGNQPANRIYFHTTSYQGTGLYIDVPIGNYTALQLASTLTTLLNSASFIAAILITPGWIVTPGLGSVTYDPITSKFSWYFQIDNMTVLDQIYMAPYGGSNDMGLLDLNVLLGLDNGVTGLNLFTQTIVGSGIGDIVDMTFTSNYANPVGANYITVNSKKLGPILKCIQNEDVSNGQNTYGYDVIGLSSPAIAKVPLNVGNGEVQTWQDPGHAQVFETPFLRKIDRFDLYLTLGPYKTPIDLNGLPFQVKFKLLIKTDTSPLSLKSITIP